MKSLRGRRLITLWLIEDGSDGRPHLCKMLAKPELIMDCDLIRCTAAAEAKFSKQQPNQLQEESAL